MVGMRSFGPVAFRDLGISDEMFVPNSFAHHGSRFRRQDQIAGRMPQPRFQALSTGRAFEKLRFQIIAAER